MHLRGLTDVPTSDLEKLLRVVHHGQLPCPLDVPGLTCVGLQHIADRVDVLRGLDERAVRVVITTVIAERRHAQKVRGFPPREA